jgi:plasmid stabilization system protein ParE
MKRSVVIFRKAQSDIDRIRAWIQPHSAIGAQRWFEACAEAILSLQDSPLSYALAPESSQLGLQLRERFFKTASGRRYRILFVVAGNQVRVLRVRGPGQQPVTWDDLV